MRVIRSGFGGDVLGSVEGVADEISGCNAPQNSELYYTTGQTSFERLATVCRQGLNG